MIDVSIIIVNYSTEDLIIQCVESVFMKVQGVNYEIIVVDNASPNNTFNHLETLYKGNDYVKCVRLKENVGFGRANNAGYKESNGRNIFCLNPDTVLINNAVKILSDYLDSHDNVGLCGGNLFHKDGKFCTSYNMTFPSI